MGKASNKKERREFDWASQVFEKVLVKFAYFGTGFHGLACQSVENQPGVAEQTVEYQLFEAFRKTKLVNIDDEGLLGEDQKHDYSRCGRTDKGVHAAGNFFTVRMRVLKQAAQEKASDEGQDPRLKPLNGVLPAEIRVLHIQRVAEIEGVDASDTAAVARYSARFSCLFRVYRYFFVVEGHDLEKMREAARHLLGSHDFRNFCKMDLGQTRGNFVRRILSIEIGEADAHGVVCCEVRGLSFLWHQIRCIMSILFLVGEGKEEAEITRTLLDVEAVPGKPVYPLADEAGLVLYDCVFEGTKFKVPAPHQPKTTWPESEAGGVGLYSALHKSSLVRAAVIGCLEEASRECASLQFTRTPAKYTKLLALARCPTLDVKLKQWNEGKPAEQQLQVAARVPEVKESSPGVDVCPPREVGVDDERMLKIRRLEAGSKA